ncbi:MAG: hypothetical protein HN712_20450 [Gemmatimonadetes bacterium]|nr:hypothetical protein [Gemmatimonadota bacterium]MBT6149229.1 hypothetical protein [Gemmatimonadota bacterium]MBT7862698.1 hypothetical protein [Gemmatimonadota bacterium]
MTEQQHRPEADALQQTHGAVRQLRQDLSRWLDQSSLMDGPHRNHGGEDEANYALTWFPHYLVTGEAAIIDRFQSLLADLLTWVRTDGHHGYEPEAEAHHGTEPFLLFLPRYLALCPEDTGALEALEDAAHHIGNWVEEIPAWYDEARDCFHSWKIGSRVIGDDPRYAIEVAEHLRFVHIALAAHRVSDQTESRYLTWALRYGRKRAERLLAASGQVPLAWNQAGEPLYWDQVRDRPEMKGMVALAHKVDGDPLAGVENHLASGAVQCYGDLYEASGDEIFRDAARRLVAPLIGEIGDRFGDVSAVAISHYRQVFGDTGFDAELMAVIDSFPVPSDAPLTLMLPEDATRREPGPGKRSDMLYWGEWGEDGSARPLIQPSTAALTLAYQLTGDVEYARRALDQASRKFNMARRILRGGREHADMGGAICSVAAGHGRNWGAGAVTGCYGPLLLGARDAFGAVRPTVVVSDREGTQRIPEDVLSLVQPAVAGEGELLLYNGSDVPQDLAWRHGTGQDVPVSLAAGETKRFPLVATVESEKSL